MVHTQVRGVIGETHDGFFYRRASYLTRQQIDWCLDNIGVDREETWFYRNGMIYFADARDFVRFLLRWP